MEKEIHVKSYVKQDGTQVKEHFRTIDTNEKMYENPEPHFPEGEYPVVVAKNPNGGSKESNKGEILEKVLLGLGFVLTVAGEISRAIQSGSKLTKGMIQQFNTGISYLKQESAASDKRLHELLASMSNIHTQEEYSNLLKRISQEKQLGQYLNRKITIMNHAAQNNDYSMAVNELQNYKSDFDEVINKTPNKQQMRMPIMNYSKENDKYTELINDLHNYHGNFDEIIKKTQKERPLIILDKSKKHNKLGQIKAGIDKTSIDTGVPFANFFGIMHDGKELWKASSHDFKYSKDYINKNGTLVYSINDLPIAIQPIVRKKVKSQLKTDDALGAVFHHESSLSKAIANSKEIKRYFFENLNTLTQGGVVNSSAIFRSNWNLQNAIQKADILYGFIDKNGDFNAIILDTWDFNPNENVLIQMAKNTQEYKLIRNYYTLILIKITIFDILEWYIN